MDPLTAIYLVQVIWSWNESVWPLLPVIVM